MIALTQGCTIYRAEKIFLEGEPDIDSETLKTWLRQHEIKTPTEEERERFRLRLDASEKAHKKQ